MEKELRYQILRATVRDRVFLKDSWRDVRPQDFPEIEERVVAEAAVTFYEKYEEPAGGLLRSWTEDIARREKLGSEGKKKLHNLLDLILGANMELVPVKALQDRVANLKASSFYENAVEEIIEAQEQGKLSAFTLAKLVEKAQSELSSNGYISRNYFSELEDRIERRRFASGNKFPLFMIDALDRRISGIGRGMLAMFLAPPVGGKGLALIHMATAYAMQGLNVLHITLEDPIDLVENRLDACLTGLPLNRIAILPNRLRKRFERVKREMRGRIHIVNGVDEGWTVTQVERAWENERKHGFTPDVLIIDYDDEIVCEKVFKGESGRRFEFAEIYRRLRRLAARTETILWTAGQTGKAGENKKIITGKDSAEDYSKIRKVFLAIGIGRDPERNDIRYLNVIKHRTDRSHFAVEIASNYGSAIFYDREESLKLRRAVR